MIETRRLEPNDWSLYRTLRLAALVDTPDAFGGTFADAAVRTDAYWRDRLERADPGSSHPLVAMLDGTSCALAWVMTEDVRANEAALFHMWVAPETRGRHVAHRLVEVCVGWAVSRGHALVSLDCTLGNEPARHLYECHGFIATGERRPLREDSDIVVERMMRRLSDRPGITGPGTRPVSR